MSTFISPEDLGRLRMAIARKMAVDLKPEAFNNQDIEQAYIAFWRTQEDVLKANGHCPGDPYQFDLVVGEITNES